MDGRSIFASRLLNLKAYGRAIKANPQEWTAYYYYDVLSAPMVREYRRKYGQDPPPFSF